MQPWSQSLESTQCIYNKRFYDHAHIERLIPQKDFIVQRFLLHSSWEYKGVHIYIYIYIYAFSRRFYPKRLTLHSSYSFYILSALAFPGNRTHDLGVANAMLYQLSYRKAYICAIWCFSWSSCCWHVESVFCFYQRWQTRLVSCLYVGINT